MKYLDRRGIAFFLLVDAALVALAVSVFFMGRAGSGGPLAAPSDGGMRLTSPAFADGGTLPTDATCDGAGTRPPLVIAGVPSNAKSLAIVVEDPDAPFGTFTHWVAWGIAPGTARIDPAALPVGATEGLNSANKTGWQPPCPPFGSHRYVFRLYALDAPLTLDAASDLAAFRAAVAAHTLGTAELMGRYSRQK